MEAPAGLDSQRLDLQQRSTLQSCFVDIPDFSDTIADQPATEVLRGDDDCSEPPAGSSESGEATDTFDVSNFLEPDFAFSKPAASAMEERSSGRSETVKEDGSTSMFDLLANSCKQEVCACVPKRLSEESLQSVGSMQTPFKPSYYKSEADLFPDFAKIQEPMLFVPLTESSAASRKKPKHAVGRRMSVISELVQEQDFDALTPAKVKELKDELGMGRSADKHESTFGSPRLARSKRRKRSSGYFEHSANETSGLKEREKREDSPISLGTPTSVVSDLPILRLKRKAQRLEGDETRQGEALVQESVLLPSSPNLPQKKASRVLKLTASAKKTAKKLSLEKEAEPVISSRRSASAEMALEVPETSDEPAQDQQAEKASKRRVSDILLTPGCT